MSSSEKEHYLRAELYREVRSSPTLFDFIQDGCVDGLWYWDLKEPEHEWMSPGFWKLFGYSPAEKKHLASEWQNMIHPDDLLLAMDNYEQHCADSSHPYDQTVRYRHKKGHWITVRCRGLVIRDEEGNPDRMLGCHTNLTPQIEAEQRLQVNNQLLKAELELGQSRNRELIANNRMLDQFAAAISHDLKAPLRGIRMAVGWLQSELGEAELSDNAQENMGFLISRTARLERLIDGVLQYSRAERAEIQVSSVSVVEVVSDVVTGLSEHDRSRLNFPAHLPEVWFDQQQLFQVFQNLIDNALRHGKGEVSVVFEDRGDHFWFGIADQGPGISPAHHERIFNLFTTLKSRDELDTTGAGLSICKAIVERSGGTIGVESRVGEGSRFWFTIAQCGKESAELRTHHE